MRSLKDSHSQCIMCGNENPFSLKLAYNSHDKESVETEFHTSLYLQGYRGMIHGGVISALHDSAMTHCLFKQGVKAYTGELKVRFLHPIPCDTLLNIRAKVVEKIPPLYKLRAEIKLNNKVASWAEAKFMKRK